MTAKRSRSLALDSQLLQDLFGTSAIGFAVEDLDGKPLFVNSAFCAFLGFSAEELEHKHCVDFSPPEDAAKDWELFQQLRAGAIDHYQLEKRYFRGDGSLVWGRLSVSLFRCHPVPLVLAMVEDITDKRAAQDRELASLHALRELNRTLLEQAAALQFRKELLETFVKNVPAGVAMLDRNLCYLQVSERWCADYLVNSAQILGKSHYEVFPQIPEHWKEAHRRALAGETLSAEEDRWDREGGPITWVRWELRPWKTPEGVIGGILIFAENITTRKNAEEAISGMTGKLIEAQEEERTRIARELHDDINQKLALLAVELDRGARQNKSGSGPQNSLLRARERIAEIASDVQSLSHRLHSSRLEYLGLVKAAGGFCKELSQKANVQVEFSHSEMPMNIPKEVSLSLFRILQEGLNNALKHSGVRSFKVNLQGTAEGIELTVADSGTGFDARRGLASEGLGLISMKERLHKLHGRLEIKTKPGAGTIIKAQVPLSTSRPVALAV